jgi:hypothetical protein
VKHSLGIAALLLASSSLTAADAPKPLKVFILAGQSNMEGQAVADLDGKDYNGGKGTLKHLLKDRDKRALLKHLTDGKGGWAVRQDVWVRYQPEKGPVKAGPLTLGFTPYGGKHHFGPELQFGHVIGDYFDNQVLLIKTAWGGKSLYKDFRPPSSGGEVGPYYKKMLADVQAALANLKKDFPAYDGKGYELAGFVWYHGWNDGIDPKKAVPEYEKNLVNLINDVRKDLKSPKLPVVVGELTGPWVKAPGEWATLRKAQAAAAARKEFAGNVLFVETHDFVRKAEDSPNSGHGHHEFGNAETYFLVGDALGKGMKKLLSGVSAKKEGKFSKPTSRTARKIEGWTVRVDDRLLEKANEELGKRALRFLENKLADIKVVVPKDRLEKLQAVTIVLDLGCGDLGPMQYHPSAGWLKANGHSADLAKCVHLPRRRPAYEAEHKRAAVGDPARAGACLPRPGAGLRRAARQGGVRGVQEERPRREGALVQRQARPALRADRPQGVLRRDDRGVLRGQRLLPVQPRRDEGGGAGHPRADGSRVGSGAEAEEMSPGKGASGSTPEGSLLPNQESAPDATQRTPHPPPSARSRLNAALINAKCVNACGKFPSASPEDPVCSAYSPRWFA